MLPRFKNLLVEKVASNHRIARIILNRPERLNAINDTMPAEIRQAVEWANQDKDVHVILLEGAGKGFCGGYDLADSAQNADLMDHPCQQEKYPWDPAEDFALMKQNTDNFMSLWHSPKPTIAKVHGYAAAGGSDIALCCDLLVMATNAKIGYMPCRVWGCPTTAMWTYRVGPTRAKELMFTGNVIDGVTADKWGLANVVCPPEKLEEEALKLADHISGVPRGQLAMHKQVVNQVLLTMGLAQTQALATIYDGITRHNPEGVWFRRYAQTSSFKDAVKHRDSGKPIPEQDEARELIKAMEAELKLRKPDTNGSGK
jgi:enoyl-CoA hydratase